MNFSEICILRSSVFFSLLLSLLVHASFLGFVFQTHYLPTAPPTRVSQPIEFKIIPFAWTQKPKISEKTSQRAQPYGLTSHQSLAGHERKPYLDSLSLKTQSLNHSPPTPSESGDEVSNWLFHIHQQVHEAIDYPRRLKRQGIEGQVTLNFELTPEGQLHAAQVLTTSGYPVLDQLALEGLQKATPFEYPVYLKKREGYLSLNVTIDFQLK